MGFCSQSKAENCYDSTEMKASAVLLLVALLFTVSGCQSRKDLHPQTVHTAPPAWRGVHLGLDSDEQADALVEELPRLAAIGVNVIVVEVDYSFDFQSHPELRPSHFLTKAHAQKLAREGRAHGIRIIPQINCLGHQSWAKNTSSLLAKYPECDETPGKFPDNKDIYCRSWCPQNPEVNTVVFALVDELIDAFEADAFHVGMDEVFIMASEHCPRCHGADPARLVAKAVNDFHEHI
ncbi:MAG: Beta-hexosaminidase, partial [Pedosphaera sp.]|nr:Beta-hexosaminidase [Pedosphaera sp.]